MVVGGGGRDGGAGGKWWCRVVLRAVRPLCRSNSNHSLRQVAFYASLSSTEAITTDLSNLIGIYFLSPKKKKLKRHFSFYRQMSLFISPIALIFPKSEVLIQAHVIPSLSP